MEAIIIIGALIAGGTELVKQFVPMVEGRLTVLIALLVGITVALIDTSIGVVDITVAQGIVSALATVGVVTTASKIG